jgi:hypothetical protein
MNGVTEAPGKNPAAKAAAIDKLMERASVALEAMRYFEAERLCLQALGKAYSVFDYDRMGRIMLPLQECRRQKRQLAVDTGMVIVVDRLAMVQDAPMPGCYLFRPPLIGADAREFRARADAAQAPVFVLTREPLAQDGKWPIVSVGPESSVRAKMDPPFPVQRTQESPMRDDSGAREIAIAWFEAAAEALGDAAIAKVDPEEHPVWRVDDLMEALEAFPYHEKLHQRIEEACREAVVAPAPDLRRGRPMLDDPFAF